MGRTEDHPTVEAGRSAVGKPLAVREPLARAGLVGLSVLVTVLLLEAGLRVIGYRPTKLMMGYVNPPFVRSHIPGVRHEMRPLQRWGMMFPSNPRGYFDEQNTIWYQTNNAGYRGRDFSPEKHPGTRRVAFLGDSFGFGRGVKDEDVVTTLLEARLNQRSACPIEVYNFSIEGYDLMDKAALLEHKVLQYHPDLIILWYFLDDPGTGAAVPWHPRFLPRLRQYSMLADFVGTHVDKVILHYLTIKRYNDEYRDTDERWINAKQILQRMAGLARERGIPIYLFVHPELFRLDDYPFQEIHRKVVRTARGYGFRAYDLMEVFRGREAEALWVHPLDHHSNEVAHRLAAEYVAGVLEQEGVLCRVR